MSFFNQGFNKPEDFKLVCDPGEPKDVWSIRPLTPDMVDEANIKAGVVPYAGRLLALDIARQVNDTVQKLVNEAIPDEDMSYEEKVAALTLEMFEPIQLESRKTEYRLKAKLTELELKQIQDATSWVSRQRVMILEAVIVAVNGRQTQPGEIIDLLTQLRPEDKEALSAEVYQIAFKMGHLSVAEKKAFSLQYGSTMIPSVEGGIVQNA